MYSVNAINHNLANLQSELIISWLLKLHPAGILLHVEKDHHQINPLMMDINYLSMVF